MQKKKYVLEYGNAGIAVTAGLLFGLITMLGIELFRKFYLKLPAL